MSRNGWLFVILMCIALLAYAISAGAPAERARTGTETECIEEIEDVEPDIPTDPSFERALSDLELSMDPLIARQHYNKHCSSMLKLPRDILLEILGHLSDDPVHFFLLRMVCRDFRILVNDKRFVSHMFSSYHPGCTACDGTAPDCKEATLALHYSAPCRANDQIMARILSVLHENHLCRTCKGHLRQDIICVLSRWCQFEDLDQTSSLWCECCKTRHPHQLVRPPAKTFRVIKCIGWHGYVRICEHEKVTWHEIEFHLKLLRTSRGDRDFAEAVIKRCLDWKHPRKCVSYGLGPVVTLRYNRNRRYRITISWDIHSGEGAFPSYWSDGFRASEFRAMFRSHRQNGAQFIIPKISPDYIPEMAMFSACSCLAYLGHNNQAAPLACRQSATNHNHVHLELDATGQHHFIELNKTGSPRIEIRTCERTSASGILSPCIVTRYSRWIEGEDVEGGGAIPVCHAWLHAMDRSSYSWSEYGPENSTHCSPMHCCDPSCRYSIRDCFGDCCSEPMLNMNETKKDA